MNYEFNTKEFLKILKDLVDIESHYLKEGGELKLAMKLGEIAENEGLIVEYEEVTPGRNNIFITFKGNEDGKHIVLCGHMDTVSSEGMTIEPFNGYIEEGKFWGRGSVDMKGGLASMLYAMILLRRQGFSPKGKVTLIGTVGEECPTNSDGAFALRKKGKFADMAIVGEATNLNIAAAHKGTMSLEIMIKGKAAHSSNPALGDNAIYKVVDLIKLIKEKLLPKLDERNHPLCGKATLNVGMIDGGIQNNIVPDKCKFSLNRRYIPGEEESQIVEEIVELWRELPYALDDLSISVLKETENRIPMETELGAPLVVKLLESCKRQGLNSVVNGVNYWTDGAHLRVSGIPTVIFGPGDIAQAHAAVEFIEIASMEKAVAVYIDFIKEMCS
ncbi:MAG: succinyl-diaminopimelate desuccinylase [Fusobacteria bacterium]|nr:MAG: succinyl-diaminopimelate desuccinylase [Fusobacteriota bacterium]KAF0229711.1 MAG: succinyl-diaminopimelate [Fusobacteriota bacterium]